MVWLSKRAGLLDEPVLVPAVRGLPGSGMARRQEGWLLSPPPEAQNTVSSTDFFRLVVF